MLGIQREFTMKTSVDAAFKYLWQNSLERNKIRSSNRIIANLLKINYLTKSLITRCFTKMLLSRPLKYLTKVGPFREIVS